jgi:hypothetical protein
MIHALIASVNYCSLTWYWAVILKQVKNTAQYRTIQKTIITEYSYSINSISLAFILPASPHILKNALLTIQSIVHIHPFIVSKKDCKKYHVLLHNCLKIVIFVQSIVLI